ncbi:MAG: hypothetical protein LBR32_06275, partial [Propionibacteriaceae bacterium]|nr:hypothetical protein [Propionibacteriaceae bacterium]
APVEIGTPPFPHAARATNTAVKITWGAVPDADGYVVYKYDKTKKAFVTARTRPATTRKWTDKKPPTGKLQRYKLSAYKIVDGKQLGGKPTYQVSAMPYRKTDTKVNAGAIKAIDTDGPVGIDIGQSVTYSPIELSSSFAIKGGVTAYTPMYVEPSAWGTAENKTVPDPRIRVWQLSGWDSVNIIKSFSGKNGFGTPYIDYIVDAKKLGQAKVLLVAHNGNHKTVTINIKDYAHAEFNLSSIPDTSLSYLLVTGWPQLIGDIVQHCLNTGCDLKASLDGETGDYTATGGATGDTELAAMCEQLLDEFPYPMEIDLNPGSMTFSMWRDPDKENGPKDVTYRPENWVGDDYTGYYGIAPYWFANK